jgi:hypothetical protein
MIDMLGSPCSCSNSTLEFAWCSPQNLSFSSNSYFISTDFLVWRIYQANSLYSFISYFEGQVEKIFHLCKKSNIIFISQMVNDNLSTVVFLLMIKSSFSYIFAIVVYFTSKCIFSRILLQTPDYISRGTSIDELSSNSIDEISFVVLINYIYYLNTSGFISNVSLVNRVRPSVVHSVLVLMI